MGALPTTPRAALMRDSGLKAAAVALNARQQQFVATLVSAGKCSKSTEGYDHPTLGAPVGRVAEIEHPRGRSAGRLCWRDPGEKHAVKTTILEDIPAAQRAAKL